MSATGASTASSPCGHRWPARCESRTSRLRSACSSSSRGVAGRAHRPGVAIGLATALKFFVWPLVGLWPCREAEDAATAWQRPRRSSLLLVLPFTCLDDYVRTLLQLERGFDQDSYTVFGLLAERRLGDRRSRRPRRRGDHPDHDAAHRSLSLAVAAAALTVSPIVWLDYFAPALVPLAIAYPRLSSFGGSSRC